MIRSSSHDRLTRLLKEERCMLNISHLSKTFETLKAVDDISFDVGDGEIFGAQWSRKNHDHIDDSGTAQARFGQNPNRQYGFKTDIRKIKRIMGGVNLLFVNLMAALGGCWWPFVPDTRPSFCFWPSNSSK